jgi:regulator-associated protein of mTOR
MSSLDEQAEAEASAPAAIEPQNARPVTSPRPSSSRVGQSASNRIQLATNGHAADSLRPASLSGSRRPSLMRAKSDFGPRLPSNPPAESADEVGSVDGHFNIRHGWDDQLNSEEYNHLLTSVRSTLSVTSSRRAHADKLHAEFLHVLHREET